MIARLALDWTAVLALALCFGVICFLAVLWSRREWRSRKIRVGIFLEREYREQPDDPQSPEPVDEDTQEWPLRKD